MPTKTLPHVLVALSLAARALLCATLASGSAIAADGAAFLAALAEKPRATQEDLLAIARRFARDVRRHAWLGVNDSDGSNEATIALLKAQGILDAAFRPTPGRRVDRGDAALLFARALRTRGGAGGRLWGLGRRTAYRELVDLRIIPAGGDGYQMSGAELISLLDRAREYRRKRRS